MSSEPPRRPLIVHGPRGFAYVALGCIFVGVGALGAVLPVLPTTPFLLLASFFFIRSSPRLNDRLLRSPFFGPFLRDWHQHRGVRPSVKVTAVTAVLVAVAASMIWGNLSWIGVTLLLALAAIGLVVVMRLPVIRDEREAVDAGGRGQPSAK